MPPSKCTATEMILTLKEQFAEHGIPEMPRGNNDPQFANTLFAEFAVDWMPEHNTSMLKNSCSQSQAKATIKIIKGQLM